MLTKSAARWAAPAQAAGLRFSAWNPGGCALTAACHHPRGTLQSLCQLPALAASLLPSPPGALHPALPLPLARPGPRCRRLVNMGFAERVPADADSNAADVFHARPQQTGSAAEGRAGPNSDASSSAGSGSSRVASDGQAGSSDSEGGSGRDPYSNSLDSILEAARGQGSGPARQQPGAGDPGADRRAAHAQGLEPGEKGRPLQVDLVDLENPLRPRYTGGQLAGAGGGGGAARARSRAGAACECLHRLAGTDAWPRYGLVRCGQKGWSLAWNLGLAACMPLCSGQRGPAVQPSARLLLTCLLHVHLLSCRLCGQRSAGGRAVQPAHPPGRRWAPR